MAIRVKHAPSAAAIGGSAYTVGRGQRIERDIRFATEVGLKEQALDLQAASIGAQARARRGQLGLGYAQLRSRTKQQQAELGFRKQQWQEEPTRQLEKGLQQQKLLQSKVSWQYDEGQKREMAKITTGVAWLREQVAAGKWTAEQAEQAEQQLWRKYYGIIPLPVYDDTATPQENFGSGIVKHPTTGAEYWMNPKTGKPEPFGSSYADSADFYINIAKLYTTEDEITGKKTVDWEGVDEFVRKAEGRIAQRQGLSTRAEELQKQQEQEAAEQEQEAAEEQQAEKQVAIEALPVMFDRIIKGKPKIGRKEIGIYPIFDKAYGEEAYNKTLIEAVERGMRDGISPEEVKAELDKWWDAEYDKERGQTLQKFQSRMEFEGAAQETPEQLRKGGTKQDYNRGVELGFWR